MRTPSQTVGPFFAIGLSRGPTNELPDGSVRLQGRVLDGEGAPVGDAVVELWNEDAGFARCATDPSGEFTFLLPPDARRFEVTVFARGLLKHLLTQLRIPGEPADDPTMLAREEGEGLRFDVHLQGEQETAFFEL